MEAYNIRWISSWPTEGQFCGIAEFTRNLNDEFRPFTAEVRSRSAAAISRPGLIYHDPVDVVINREDPNSWRYGLVRIQAKAIESKGPTAFIIQHEYGLFRDRKSGDPEGRRVVDLADELRDIGPTIAQLHTVLQKPTEEGEQTFRERVKVLQGLAEKCDCVVVPTASGAGILTSAPYRIDRDKVVHIDHGIRIQDPVEVDRKKMKKLYGFENTWLALTLGLKSPGKGLDTSIDGWGEFVTNSLTEKSRRGAVYLIAGIYHPDFAEAEGGRRVREYERKIKTALKKHGLKSARVRDIDALKKLDKRGLDVIFHEDFPDERTFRSFYGASNVILLPYTNQQQISSGILADAIGSGRAVITTKYPHALDLVVPGVEFKKGLITSQDARGILVDPSSPLQIRKALEVIAFDDDLRFGMESRAAIRGCQMAWPEVARQMLTVVRSYGQKRVMPHGRGPKLTGKPD